VTEPCNNLGSCDKKGRCTCDEGFFGQNCQYSKDETDTLKDDAD